MIGNIKLNYFLRKYKENYVSILGEHIGEIMFH